MVGGQQLIRQTAGSCRTPRLQDRAGLTSDRSLVGHWPSGTVTVTPQRQAVGLESCFAQKVAEGTAMEATQ